MAISGRLVGREVAFINIYAPNVEQGAFLGHLSGKLADCLVRPLIMGGDFNCVANIVLDRSHPPLRDSPAFRTARDFRDWKER